MKSDYNGFLPDQLASADDIPTIKSPIQTLTDDILRKSQEARETILKNLLENPGVIATFGNDFFVEFGDLEIRPLASLDDRNLNEYSMEVVQKWRIRRRNEEHNVTPLHTL